MTKFARLTKEELRERTWKVAEKCYDRIREAELAALEKGTPLTTLKRLDIYQSFRDRACNRINQDIMFWADYMDLFDSIYKEVEAKKEWETFIIC